MDPRGSCVVVVVVDESGNLELVQTLMRHGARDGITPALHNALSGGHREIAQWLFGEWKTRFELEELSGKDGVVSRNRTKS